MEASDCCIGSTSSTSGDLRGAFVRAEADDIFTTAVLARYGPMRLVPALRLILAYQVHRLSSEDVPVDVGSPLAHCAPSELGPGGCAVFFAYVTTLP